MSTGSALGAKLEYATFVDAETPVAYAELMHCGDYDFPLGTAEKLDVTKHASLKKDYVPGIVDPGVVAVPLIWDDEETSHEWVETNLHEKHQFRYTPKDGTAVEFLAILKNLVAANPLGTNPKERVLTLRISGGDVADEA